MLEHGFKSWKLFALLNHSHSLIILFELDIPPLSLVVKVLALISVNGHAER